MILSRSTLVAVAVAVAVPSLAMPQRPSPAGVVRHVTSAPVTIGTKKSVFADTAQHDDRVEKGATIGAILGAVSGVALGAGAGALIGGAVGKLLTWL